MANKIYQERQRYQDHFIIVFISLAILGLLYGASSYLWEPGVTLIYSLICLLLAAGLAYALYWLISLRAKLTITDKNIKFRVKGSVDATKKIAWEDVATCTLVKAPAIAKFDRPKVTLSNEKYYSLAGRNGLEITTVDGEEYFVGCERLGDLENALEGENIVIRQQK